MDQKKLWKGLALVLALALLGVLLFFANAFVGNPLSQLLAQRGAKVYLAETYPGTDYRVERVSYSFKESGYNAYMSSPTSPDSSFTVRFDWWGRPGYDDYESRVLCRGNTLRRLDDEYRDLCDRVLKRTDLPYGLDIAFGTLRDAVEHGPEPGPARPGGRPEPLCPQELVLDGGYDIPELGRKHGTLTIYAQDETVTPERAAQILLDLKERMDDAGAPFAIVDFSLELPRTKDGPAEGPSLSILGFPAGDIYPQGLEKRVRAAAQETADYYVLMSILDK